jgi:hypothetical protein
VYKTVTESDERIDREDNLANKVEIRKLHEGGRKNGDTNLSPMMRTLIGAAAEVDQNNAKTAKTFGVSDRAVANYRKGRTSHSTPIKAEAKTEVEEVVETVRDQKQDIKSKATSRLDSLFDGPISAENLQTLKPREAVSVAKDLATVIDRVSIRESGQDQKVQINIFAPRQREEKEYEVVDVSARDVS